MTQCNEIDDMATTSAVSPATSSRGLEDTAIHRKTASLMHTSIQLPYPHSPDTSTPESTETLSDDGAVYGTQGSCQSTASVDSGSQTESEYCAMCEKTRSELGREVERLCEILGCKMFEIESLERKCATAEKSCAQANLKLAKFSKRLGDLLQEPNPNVCSAAAAEGTRREEMNRQRTFKLLIENTLLKQQLQAMRRKESPQKMHK